MLGIKGKIIIVITTVSLSASIIIGWMSICKGRQVLKMAATNNMVLHGDVVCSNFERELDRIASAVQFLEALIITEMPTNYVNKTSFNEFYELLEHQMRVFGYDSGLISLWVVFNPDVVAGNPMISLYDREGDGVFEKEFSYNVLEKDLSSPTMDWWNKAIEYGAVWSLPYYWENWQMELVSYSKSVYVDGQFVACVGSDFNYGDLKLRMSNFKAFESGFFALLDADYHVIFHPLVDRVGIHLSSFLTAQEYHLFHEQTKNIENGFFEFSFEGKDRLISFRYLSNGWMMVAYVDKDEVLMPAYQHGQAILWIILIVVFVALILSFVLAYSITTPIMHIITCFRAATDGNLDTRISLRTHDELDFLSGSFNSFMDKIQNLIDQLKLQGEELSRAMMKAEESDRLKSQFLGNISHELRTPLYGVVGFSQLLDDSDLDEKMRKHYINQILVNNDKLLSFVEDTLVFSKLELNQLEPSKEFFHLEGLIDEIERQYREFSAVQSKPCEFEVRKQFDALDCIINTDRGLLKKIITVLLDNAFKFSRGGMVVLSCVVGDSFVRVYVKDSGVGIPLQYQKMIFNKFFQYQPDHRVLYGGSGMGLAIAKGIAELLNAVINVRSVVGKGSVFYVTVPR